MKPLFLATLFFLIVALAGCGSTNCPYICEGYVYISLVGFSHADFAESKLYTYSNNSYNSLISKVDIDSSWAYPSYIDTTSDTLQYDAIPIVGGSAPNAYMLVLPAVNDTYRISNVIAGGYLSENETCEEGGDPTPGLCNDGGPALRSYVINGTTMHVSDTFILYDYIAGYIYIHR